jgi:hypothetical protein
VIILNKLESITIITINNKDYTKQVSYNLIDDGYQNLSYRGFVHIWDNGKLVHWNALRVRTYAELKDMADEKILEIAEKEAVELIGEPVRVEIAEKVALYEDAVSKGRI